MSSAVDPRIPVGFAPEPLIGALAAPGCAWLIEDEIDAPAPGPVGRFATSPARHTFGCACCAPRGEVAKALDRLFLARARGAVPWFGRVLALTGGPAGEAAVRAALRQDRLVSARFRLED